MSDRTRLAAALEQLDFSRKYTKMFLEDLTPAEWLWRPSEVLTHIAWQVGHLAFAEYSLCLKRQRGLTPEDETLFPAAFVERFKKGSEAAADEADNPSVDKLQQALDAVHAQALAELSERSDEDLLAPTAPPHPMFDTNLGAVAWCAQHELVHAGQIALLRRLMGKKPLR